MSTFSDCLNAGGQIPVVKVVESAPVARLMENEKAADEVSLFPMPRR